MRTLIQRELISSLSSYDALISPVAPKTAWKLGEVIDDPLTMYKNDIMTVNLNLAGEPTYFLSRVRENRWISNIAVVGNDCLSL